jgi:hypothetical protein
MWIGLLVGVVVGAALWRIEGAIVLGFFGWLVGVIVDSRKRGETGSPEADRGPPSRSRSMCGWRSSRPRLARLERLVSGSEPVVEAPIEPVDPGRRSHAPTNLPQPVLDAAAAPPRGPSPAPKPNPIVAWFLGGNTIARVGLVILFIGLAFLLKFAADNDMLPVELRVAAVAAAGLALLITGWRLREKRPAYSPCHAGRRRGRPLPHHLRRLPPLAPDPPRGGVSSSSPPSPSFSAILGHQAGRDGAGGVRLRGRLPRADPGVHRQSAATSRSSAYFLVLNLGIAAIAWYKAWRPLNVVGFAFTFLIGLAWGFKLLPPGILSTASSRSSSSSSCCTWRSRSCSGRSRAPTPPQLNH